MLSLGMLLLPAACVAIITALEGLPGQGKTLTAVHRAWKRKQRGKPVYANIPLFDYRVKRPRQYWLFGPVIGTYPLVPDGYGKSWADGPVDSDTGATLTKLEQVFLLENAHILLDEAHLWCPATEWDKLPFGLRSTLAQQRKQGLDIDYTAQNISNVFNIIRQLTWCAFKCVKWGRVVQLIGRDANSGEKMPGGWVPIDPATTALYDTRYMVGDRSGAGAKLGSTKKYDRRWGTPLILPDDTECPALDGLRLNRVEHFPEWVRYVREKIEEQEEENPESGDNSSPGWAFG